MKGRILTKAISLLFGGALAVVPAAAMAQEGCDVAIQLTGKRNWIIDCNMVKEDGDTLQVNRKGRGSSSKTGIVLTQVVSGTCRYTVPRGGELTIRINTGVELDCPFDVTGEECMVRIAAGTEGEFAFGEKA